MAYRVTKGEQCSGEWYSWLKLGTTREAAFAVAQPDKPPPGIFGRGFVAATTPESCGLQRGSCADEFVVELSER
jgi:hypothetical protein